MAVLHAPSPSAQEHWLTLGEACRLAVTLEGMPLDSENIADIEDVLYEKNALVIRLTPELRFDKTKMRRGTPRYTWTRTAPR